MRLGQEWRLSTVVQPSLLQSRQRPATRCPRRRRSAFCERDPVVRRAVSRAPVRWRDPGRLHRRPPGRRRLDGMVGPGRRGAVDGRYRRDGVLRDQGCRIHGDSPAGRPRLLCYDTAVAEYWPEFGANGKADITVRDVLRHRSGLSHLKGVSKTELMDHLPHGGAAGRRTG